MNKLSWLIYFGDVSGTASNVFGVLSFILWIAAAVLLTLWLCYSSDWSHRENDVLVRQKCGRAGFASIVVAFFLMCIAIFLPSQKTVWMIAASEAAEQIATSDSARDLTTDLRDTIKYLLAQARSKKKDD